MNNQHVHPVESSASKGSGIRVVSSLSELDQIMQELDATASISDDELRRVFTTFKMGFPVELPDDPYSKEYADRQFEVYRYLRGESYHSSNEVDSPGAQGPGSPEARRVE